MVDGIVFVQVTLAHDILINIGKMGFNDRQLQQFLQHAFFYFGLFYDLSFINEWCLWMCALSFRLTLFFFLLQTYWEKDPNNTKHQSHQVYEWYVHNWSTYFRLELTRAQTKYFNKLYSNFFYELFNVFMANFWNAGRNRFYGIFSIVTRF